MSTRRFTPEFKEEAVRQVVDRGHSVVEISARLGVSSHSLYKWVKAVTPDRTEKQAAERGEVNFGIENVAKLAVALQIQPYAMLQELKRA
jgi:transposase-like protein